MSFRLLGIDFTISYIFALSLTLFIAFDKSGSFLPLVISVTVHELSHLLAMCFFRAKPNEISLSIGTINIKNNHLLTLSEEITTLLAGPLSNLIIYVVFSCFNLNKNFANINLILFIFNMLCVDGLDGGSILKAILNNYLSENFAKIILLIVKVLNLMAFITFFLFFLKHNIVNYTFLFFIIYLFFKI